jgi:hypothetical protein
VHTAPRATGRSEDVDQGVQSQAELKAVEQAPCAALPESLLPASIALNNWVDASMDDDLNLFEQMDANYFFPFNVRFVILYSPMSTSHAWHIQVQSLLQK